MNIGTDCDFPDNLLERYAMGKLSEQESAPLEEHLLVCPPCQQRLDELDEFLAVTKTALAAKTPRSPQLMWAAGLAAVLLILMAPLYHNPITAVTLNTERGAAAFPRVQSGGGVLLRIDVTQIPQPDGYQLEVVDSGGQPVWHAAAEAFHDGIVTTVPKRLAPGRYWIRLYDTGSPWNLLREYGLDVD
ncbi:MAG: zf-HC2 domain-containing protein [Acidobacteriia bacterium]|nr:zf-HC2 domain-containing protein [Terriglobia bacterium]